MISNSKHPPFSRHLGGACFTLTLFDGLAGQPGAGPPAHQSPSVKPQTLDPQLAHQQLQVQGAGRMVNHHTPFRVANLSNLGQLAEEGY